MDIPHLIVRVFMKCLHDAKQARKENKKPFMDTYQFIIGFHTPYALCTFAIAMIFSTIVPYVPVFAGVFFMFKYFVDKYNLSFEYNTDFNGVCIIKGRVVPLMLFNIILYQLINVGFFASKVESNNKAFLYIGLAWVVFEILVIFFIWAIGKRMRYLRHKNMRDEQEAHERKESEEKRSKLTARMVEGTIVQNALEMGGLS